MPGSKLIFLSWIQKLQVAPLPSKTVGWAGSASYLGGPRNHFRPLLIGPFSSLLEKIFSCSFQSCLSLGADGCWKGQHRIGCWGWLGHASSSCSSCCGHHCSGPGFRIRSQLPRPKAQTAGSKQGPGAETQASEPFQPSVPVSPPIASGGSYSEVWSVSSEVKVAE